MAAAALQHFQDFATPRAAAAAKAIAVTLTSLSLALLLLQLMSGWNSASTSSSRWLPSAQVT